MAKSSIGNIIHCAAVRYHLTGAGNFQSILRSLDNVRNVQLANIPMQTFTNRQPTILANFQEQEIQLEGLTTEINEFFYIDKIVIFIKPVAEGYPI